MFVFSIQDLILIGIIATTLLIFIISWIWYKIKSMIYKNCKYCKYCRVSGVAGYGDGARYRCDKLNINLTPNGMIKSHEKIFKRCKHFK